MHWSKASFPPSIEENGKNNASHEVGFEHETGLPRVWAPLSLRPPCPFLPVLLGLQPCLQNGVIFPGLQGDHRRLEMKRQMYDEAPSHTSDRVQFSYKAPTK